MEKHHNFPLSIFSQTFKHKNLSACKLHADKLIERTTKFKLLSTSFMKTISLSAILGVLFLMACSDTIDPEPAQRISQISLFDVGNSGDASDISVAFSIQNIGQIAEFRVLVMTPEISVDFSKKQALLLTAERYKTISLAHGEKYSIRLSEILDVMGNTIIADKEYVVRILMVGRQFNQLSMLTSNPLSLTEQGIYNGTYQGVLVHNIRSQDRFLPSGQDATVILRGPISESSEGYIGQLTTEIVTTGFAGFQSAFGNSTIRFSIDGDSISGFDASNSLIPFISTYVNCELKNTGVFFGTATEGLKLEILGEGCSEGKFTIKLNRTFP